MTRASLPLSVPKKSFLLSLKFSISSLIKLFLAFLIKILTLFWALVFEAFFSARSQSFMYSTSSPTSHSGFDLGKLKVIKGLRYLEFQIYYYKVYPIVYLFHVNCKTPSSLFVWLRRGVVAVLVNVVGIVNLFNRGQKLLL